jgi:hypothetical protein
VFGTSLRALRESHACQIITTDGRRCLCEVRVEKLRVERKRRRRTPGTPGRAQLSLVRAGLCPPFFLWPFTFCVLVCRPLPPAPSLARLTSNHRPTEKLKHRSSVLPQPEILTEGNEVNEAPPKHRSTETPSRVCETGEAKHRSTDPPPFHLQLSAFPTFINHLPPSPTGNCKLNTADQP